MSETIDFVAKDGQSYEITLDDCGEEISVSLNGKRLGQITLSLKDDGDERSGHEWFHITHLELDNCGGIGIGTRCHRPPQRSHRMFTVMEPLSCGQTGIGHGVSGVGFCRF